MNQVPAIDRSMSAARFDRALSCAIKKAEDELIGLVTVAQAWLREGSLQGMHEDNTVEFVQASITVRDAWEKERCSEGDLVDKVSEFAKIVGALTSRWFQLKAHVVAQEPGEFDHDNMLEAGDGEEANDDIMGPWVPKGSSESLPDPWEDMFGDDEDSEELQPLARRCNAESTKGTGRGSSSSKGKGKKKEDQNASNKGKGKQGKAKKATNKISKKPAAASSSSSNSCSSGSGSSKGKPKK
jgi:hypothetical protein